MAMKLGMRVATSGSVNCGISSPWSRRELKSFLAAMYGKNTVRFEVDLSKKNSPLLLDALSMIVVGVPVRS